MRFLREWLSIAGMDFDTVLSGWRYTCFSDGALCVEGHRGVISVGAESVLLKVHNGTLEITGKTLTVSYAGDGVLVVRGKGLAVDVEER